jgi:hypothetical protein
MKIFNYIIAPVFLAVFVWSNYMKHEEINELRGYILANHKLRNSVDSLNNTKIQTLKAIIKHNELLERDCPEWETDTIKVN